MRAPRTSGNDKQDKINVWRHAWPEDIRTFARTKHTHARTHARNCYDYEVLIVLSKYAWRRRHKKCYTTLNCTGGFFVVVVLHGFGGRFQSMTHKCARPQQFDQGITKQNTHTHTREAAAAHLINNFILLNNAAQNTHSRTRLAYYRVSARGCCCYPQLKSIILPA